MKPDRSHRSAFLGVKQTPCITAEEDMQHFREEKIRLDVESSLGDSDPVHTLSPH